MHSPSVGIALRVLVGDMFDAAIFDPLVSGFQQCGGVYDRIRTATLFYIHCYQTLVGRYVILHAAATSTKLTLCEVKVYPEPGEIVFNLPTFLTS